MYLSIFVGIAYLTFRKSLDRPSIPAKDTQGRILKGLNEWIKLQTKKTQSRNVCVMYAVYSILKQSLKCICCKVRNIKHNATFVRLTEDATRLYIVCYKYVSLYSINLDYTVTCTYD